MERSTRNLQEEIEHLQRALKCAERLCEERFEIILILQKEANENAKMLQEFNQTAGERFQTIKRLRKELDFMKGVKMEREERNQTAEFDPAERKAAIAAELGSKMNPKYPPIVSTVPGGARSELLDTGLTQIPHSAKREIGKIFAEGAKKYGQDNWKKGVYDKPYQRSRAEHAYNHFSEYLDNSSSDGSSPVQQLAKVAWFCVTQIDTLLREKEPKEEIAEGAIEPHLR